ncbi:phosphoribosylpyrophosphate synthetase [Bordetella genomosp. 9]|uniref:Phosphoribosylpyrophosphate synthetase n=1 Tax=Bordetella genomosp. 9 TaxID=1416803 RepID=A0A261R609_9BORD|nr:ribose-phosphate pyrophosphokinase [Bordetella genomosp. 9]OZI20466.1 phosphoribosylpyrophosphate synthetase [Bordetella genomosp. 9]
MERLILPLPGNEAFATRLAALCRAELGAVETRRFPDGESYVRLHGDPRGRAVDIVCTLARPDPGFLSLVFAADAARELGAVEVNLVAPYLAYMRQDKRFQPGESVSSLSFARLVSSTFDRLLTVDPHLHRHPALSALYTIPTSTLHAAPRLADWIAANVPTPLIIGPDEESEQWAGSIAARIGAPHAVLRKVRHGDREVDVEAPDLSRWRDHTPVLVDDIASSGRTLVAAAAKLSGMKPPQCVVVHALFAEDAWAQVSRCFERVVSTDTVPHPSNRIEIGPLLADALLRDLRD